MKKRATKIISPSYRQTQHVIMAHGEPNSELQERHEAVSWSTSPGKEYVSHKGAK